MAQDLVAGAKGAADYLGIQPSSIYHMTRMKQLPVIRKGKRLYFRKSELEAAFQSDAD